MLFLLAAFVAGMIIYYFECKNKTLRHQLIESFMKETRRDGKLPKEEQDKKFVDFFHANQYRVEKRGRGFIARKREFSLGLFLMGAGIGFIGAILYLVWYYKIEKPTEFTF